MGTASRNRNMALPPRRPWLVLVLLAMQMACATAATGEDQILARNSEELFELSDEGPDLSNSLRLEASALKAASLETLNLIEESAGADTGGPDDCDDLIALAKECADRLKRSHTFLERIQEAPATGGLKQPSMLAKAETMLGESEAAEEKARPEYCIETNAVLKKCHAQLFKVTAFMEKVGVGPEGSPRPGMPGSDTPVTPKRPDPESKEKKGLIKGSTNDVIYQNISLTPSEVAAAEQICDNIEQAEVVADTDAYRQKDQYGFDSELKQTTKTLINMHLQERVNFFASERSNKKIPTDPKPDDLPKCQKCWQRRRRAGRSGEVNSCSPPPPPPPEEKKEETKKKEEPAVEPPVNEYVTPEPDDDEKEVPVVKPAAAAAVNTTTASAVDNTGPIGFVAGYTTPLMLQNRFFYGALTYQAKGAWSCNVKGGAVLTCAGVGGNLPCEMKGPGSAQACKAKCDACDGCAGSNFVRNPVTQNEGKGGLCIFTDKDPETSPAMMAASKKCSVFTPEFKNTTCASPMGDQDFYCCSQAAYFKKRPKIERKCLACCESVDPARKCDGPMCEDCVKNPLKLGTCDAAKTCCRQTPPCDDSTCSACPDPANDGKIKTLTKADGTAIQYNIPQEAKEGPYKLAGYETPEDSQGFFFRGALNVRGGGEYSCSSRFSADVKSPMMCTTKPHLSKLQDCKIFCDNSKTCVGFNLIYNGYNVRDTGNEHYDGGLCVFLSQDPIPAGTDKVTCASWTGNDATCVAPGIDKSMNCCSDGFYYRKTKQPPVCSAVTETGKKRKCIFPFKYQGAEYSKCIARDNDSGKPWCMTDTIVGEWGECEKESCQATGKFGGVEEKSEVTAFFQQ